MPQARCHTRFDRGADQIVVGPVRFLQGFLSSNSSVACLARQPPASVQLCCSSVAALLQLCCMLSRQPPESGVPRIQSCCSSVAALLHA
jgi:hypothetical protein